MNNRRFSDRCEQFEAAEKFGETDKVINAWQMP